MRSFASLVIGITFSFYMLRDKPRPPLGCVFDGKLYDGINAGAPLTVGIFHYSSAGRRHQPTSLHGALRGRERWSGHRSQPSAGRRRADQRRHCGHIRRELDPVEYRGRWDPAAAARLSRTAAGRRRGGRERLLRGYRQLSDPGRVKVTARRPAARLPPAE